MPEIRIKEMNGQYATAGYFYAPGKKLKPGGTAEVDDAESHLKTGLVELVPAKRGRPKKEGNENAAD